MSLKHAILGFLSFQPMTGYDLKKAFDHSVQFFWPANQSQIYRTLAELSDEELVNIEIVAREDRLDMKIYHITETGLAEFRHWLSTPLPHQDYREAFLIQVYFGGKIDDRETIALLRHMIREIEEALGQLTILYKMYLGKLDQVDARRDLFFNMLTLEYGISSNQTALNWLHSVLNRLQAGDYSPQEIKTLIG
jgi:PadR family transcriptional regulator, regulatory protein AphA